MSRRFLKLIILGFIMVGAFSACTGLLGSSEPQVRTELVTVEVVITATTDPNVTPNVIIITQTPDRPVVDVPDDLIPDDDEVDADGTALAEDDGAVARSAAGDGTDGDSDGVPDSCPVYAIAEGDTPFGIALEFEVDGFLLLEVNGLTEEDAQNLQIGQELIVPVEGCPVDLLIVTDTPTPTETLTPSITPTPSDTPESSDTPEPTATSSNTPRPSATPTNTPTATPDVTLTPSITPTVTLAATATNAQVEIVGVLGLGDVTTEGIRVRNEGSTVNVTGWTLTDVDGNEYVFTEQIIFSQQEVTVFTRPGQDTPVARFWGLDAPVWADGDVATLRNEDGSVQATLRLRADQN